METVGLRVEVLDLFRAGAASLHKLEQTEPPVPLRIEDRESGINVH